MKARQLFFISLMLVFLNADQMVMSPNIGAIEKEFSITDAHIGVVASTFTILGALVSLLWGYLSDKYSRKALLISSILVGEIPAFMSAFSKSYAELFFWRTLTGIGVGASFPISHSMIGDMYGRKERARASAVLTISVSVGGITGMIVGGYAGSVWGWRIPFILVSAPNFLLALIAWRVLKEPKRGSMEDEIADLIERGREYPTRIRLKDYLKLFSIKTNLLLFLQGIAGTIPWGAIPYYLVEFLRRERDLEVSVATSVFLAFGIGNVLGTLIGGWAGEKIYGKNKKFVPIFTSFTTAAGVLATVLTLSYRPVGTLGVILLSIMGMGSAVLVSLTGPNVKMMLLNVNEPGDRGRIFSVFNLTDSLGTGIGKYFGGALSTFLGSLGLALIYSSYFWLICAFLLFLLTFHFEKDVMALSEKLRKLREEME